MFSRVAIDADLGRLFDYAIPEACSERALPGARVTVPFGHRTATNYIVEVVESAATRDAAGSSTPPELPLLPGLPAGTAPPTAPAVIKSLLTVEGDRPFILPSLLKLARWIADYYCAPLERCLQAVLPAPVRSGRAREKERLFVEAAGRDAGFRVQGSGVRMGSVPHLVFGCWILDIGH